MKRKDITELWQKSLPELRKILEETKNKLIKLKMEIKTEKNKNVRALARVKDEIAKVATLLREKELKEEEK